MKGQGFDVLRRLSRKLLRFAEMAAGLVLFVLAVVLIFTAALGILLVVGAREFVNSLSVRWRHA